YVFMRRLKRLEDKIKTFENEGEPVLEACQALTSLVAQAQQAPAAGACGATPVSTAPANSRAMLDLVAQAREAATRARQLVSQLEADRKSLDAEITDFSYAFPSNEMMRQLVTGWRSRLQLANCSLADIDQAQAAIDKAAADALKGQTAAACPGSQ